MNTHEELQAAIKKLPSISNQELAEELRKHTVLTQWKEALRDEVFARIVTGAVGKPFGL